MLPRSRSSFTRTGDGATDGWTERRKKERRRRTLRGNSGRGTGQEEGLAGKWKIEFAAFLPLPPSLFALWAVKENLFNLPRSAYSREQRGNSNAMQPTRGPRLRKRRTSWKKIERTPTRPLPKAKALSRIFLHQLIHNHTRTDQLWFSMQLCKSSMFSSFHYNEEENGCDVLAYSHRRYG